MKDRPIFCDDCPVLAQIGSGIKAEVTAVASDERRVKRWGDPLLGFGKVFIAYSTVIDSENPAVPVETKLRMPVKAGMGSSREDVKDRVTRCNEPKKGYEDTMRCPAISLIAPSNRSH